MAKREDLISKAKELIKAQPKAGRREIASDLRREYGQALRDSVILSLQREIYPKPQARLYQRAGSLRKDGFLPFEVQGRLNKKGEKVGLKDRPFNASPWFKKVRSNRAKELEEFSQRLRGEGKNKRQINKEWRDNIIEQYKDAQWQLDDGTLDPWQMFRDMRAEAISAGVWEETPRKKGSHRGKRAGDGPKRIEKGKVKEQRVRWRDKQRAKRNISDAYLYGLKRK